MGARKLPPHISGSLGTQQRELGSSRSIFGRGFDLRPREVVAGGGLVHAEAEAAHYGVDVVENVTLNLFKLYPFRAAREEIELLLAPAIGKTILPQPIRPCTPADEDSTQRCWPMGQSLRVAERRVP